MARFFLLLVFLMISTGCTSTAKTFEQARASTVAIQEAIAEGVGYDRFGALIQNLSAEIDKTRVNAKSGEKQRALLSYIAILESYEHSRAAWKLLIDFNKFNKGSTEFSKTTSIGIGRSFLIQGYWKDAEEEFKKVSGT